MFGVIRVVAILLISNVLISCTGSETESELLLTIRGNNSVLGGESVTLVASTDKPRDSVVITWTDPDGLVLNTIHEGYELTINTSELDETVNTQLNVTATYKNNTYSKSFPLTILKNEKVQYSFYDVGYRAAYATENLLALPKFFTELIANHQIRYESGKYACYKSYWDSETVEYGLEIEGSTTSLSNQSILIFDFLECDSSILGDDLTGQVKVSITQLDDIETSFQLNMEFIDFKYTAKHFEKIFVSNGQLMFDVSNLTTQPTFEFVSSDNYQLKIDDSYHLDVVPSKVISTTELNAASYIVEASFEYNEIGSSAIFDVIQLKPFSGTTGQRPIGGKQDIISINDDIVTIVANVQGISFSDIYGDISNLFSQYFYPNAFSILPKLKFSAQSEVDVQDILGIEYPYGLDGVKTDEPITILTNYIDHDITEENVEISCDKTPSVVNANVTSLTTRLIVTPESELVANSACYVNLSLQTSEGLAYLIGLPFNTSDIQASNVGTNKFNL